MSAPLAYPLSWPAGKLRTEPGKRRPAPFGTRDWRGSPHRLVMPVALARLDHEIAALGAAEVVLSTNLELRLDGKPRAQQRALSDPGAALYFKLEGRPIALACDKWDTVADNIGALAKHIESLRGQERWGVGSIAQAFTGYAALPAPGGHSRRDWRDVLDLRNRGDRPGNIDLDDVEQRFRELARSRHPDGGGTADAFAELVEARDTARRELGA